MSFVCLSFMEDSCNDGDEVEETGEEKWREWWEI